jgi:DNA adenine methylase
LLTSQNTVITLSAANVLLVKEPSKLETYNDLNDDIVNFFRVLRDRPEDLIHKIKLTPWSRTEFMNCIEESEDPVENARRLFFRLWMSLAGGMVKNKASFRRHKGGTRSIASDIRPENLYRASERLTKVLIEKRDALQLITEMDSPDTLFYIDPPYVKSTRTDKNVYSHELTDEQHRQLEVLHDLKGMVVLSGYPSTLYSELFEARGWQRSDRDSKINFGAIRTESLWISPRTSLALNGNISAVR